MENREHTAKNRIVWKPLERPESHTSGIGVADALQILEELTQHFLVIVARCIHESLINLFTVLLSLKQCVCYKGMTRSNGSFAFREEQQAGCLSKHIATEVAVWY